MERLNRWATSVGLLLLWFLVLVPPFVLVLSARDPFRLPKLLLTELLALATLLFLSSRLLTGPANGWRRIWRLPAVQLVAPLVVVASCGLLTSHHTAHVREAVWDLWIGAVCLVAWSMALSSADLRKLLDGLVLPAVALSAFAVVQYHDLYRPLAFVRGEEAVRLGVTSTAGSVGDLAAYLLLPCLVAQVGVWRRFVLRPQGKKKRRRSRAGWGGAGWLAALGVTVYGVAVSQTLTALVALAVATGVLWWLLIAERRVRYFGFAGLVLLGLALGLGPLRGRVVRTAKQLERGDVNAVVTGRVDAWRAGLWMLRQHPLTGVGHGAFVTEFSPAKLSLLEEGVPFYQGHGPNATFANAHNELLEVAGELGLLGVAVVVAMAAVVLRSVRSSGAGYRGRRAGLGGPRSDSAAWEERGSRALIWAGLTAVALLSMGYFPWRVALVAYPWILFLSWLLSRHRDEATAKEGVVGEVRSSVAGRLVAAVLVLVVALALGAQWRRTSNRLRASRQLQQVEVITQQLAQAQSLSRPLLQANLRVLQGARELDPSAVGIPMAIGSHYFLLSRPDRAVEWYRRALELEPRPEIYLNLGRALLPSDEAGARESLQRAVQLNPRLAEEVPAAYR